VKGDFEISEMTPGDLEGVCRIENEVFANPWPRSAFENDLSSDSTFCTVVRNSSGLLVGYSCLMIVADEAHLSNIAVSMGHRRNGIGSMLMDHMIAKAELEGSRAIFLEVRSSNEDALNLYWRYDFVELYRRKDYYRKPNEDALIMVRPVGERNSHG
jgi:ribosomal-protein-alanine N-acetyltransferase